MRQATVFSATAIALLFLAGCSGAQTTPEAVNGGTEAEPPASPTPAPLSDDPPAAQPPVGALREFSTDFSKSNVDTTQIMSGGPPKDGIPAIDNPVFESVETAGEWLAPEEPIIFVQVGEDARAYPLQVLMWHEIVNDTVGGEPVLVTFCPLCNTGIAFERTVAGEVLDFGTTGRLRFSNLIMYDRQTETWWQQATGEAIIGEQVGAQLQFLPAPIIAWDEFRSAHPDGMVLSRETGFQRPYGNNPYAGYDNINNSPFLYRGPTLPDELPAMARVFAVEIGGETVAFAYDTLAEVKVMNEQIGGEPVVVFWKAGTASALDVRQLSDGRDVGAAVAFSRRVDDRTLTFTVDGEDFLDEETGSRWNLLGVAIDGPLAGAELSQVVGVNHFWFSWAVFAPDTRIATP